MGLRVTDRRAAEVRPERPLLYQKRQHDSRAIAHSGTVIGGSTHYDTPHHPEKQEKRSVFGFQHAPDGVDRLVLALVIRARLELGEEAERDELGGGGDEQDARQDGR